MFVEDLVDFSLGSGEVAVQEPELGRWFEAKDFLQTLIAMVQCIFNDVSFGQLKIAVARGPMFDFCTEQYFFSKKGEFQQLKMPTSSSSKSWC